MIHSGTSIFEILDMNWGITESDKNDPGVAREREVFRWTNCSFTGSCRRTRTTPQSQLDRLKRSTSRLCRNFRGQEK